MRSFISKIENFYKLNAHDRSGANLFSPVIKELRIPLYQREYKWTNEKIAELIRDVNSRDKFLGILILDERDSYYEIVDGQQRITTCYLALMCLYNLYEGHLREQTSIDSLIRPFNNEFVLKNESVGDFISITDSHKMRLSILPEADVYYQADDFSRAYQQVYDILSSFSDLNSLRSFKQKLLDSQFLILINDTQNNTRPVEQIFLDINEKSQLLEQADIFKGHCFKNYGNEYADELKALWVSLKKCAVEFTKWGFKDFDEFLYTYLLLAVDPQMPSNLSPNGKHYLDGKSIDETEAVLTEMIQYGQHAVMYHKQVADVRYNFNDLCSDANNYAHSGRIPILKQLSLQMLESKGAQYQKLPLLFLIHKSYQYAENDHKWHLGDFQKIITNLFIYSSLFILSGTRKSKSTLDHTIYDCLIEQTIQVRNVIAAAQSLRKEKVDEFEMPNNLNKYLSLAELYTVMDYYHPSENRIGKTYLDNDDYTIEHFIVPDNRNRRIHWKKHGKDIVIDLPLLARNYKKKTINYLILPKGLNEDLQDYDIITKVTMIKEYYHQDSLPKHIQVFVTQIESLAEYKKLVDLHNTTDSITLTNAYNAFVNAYFSDTNDVSLRGNLTATYKSVFRNEV